MGMKRKRDETVSGVCRQFILDANKGGRSFYSIAKEAGIQQASFVRFVHGERGLRLKDFDVLCRVLGARLVFNSSPKKGA